MRPRVFISSTHYDLKYLRASLQGLVESLGFEAVVSERNAITYSPESPLDESCYRAAATADIFVLIIGGRYGSPSSKHAGADHRDFNVIYESVTRGEYEAATQNMVPCYILIEGNVHADYDIFSLNPKAKRLKYPHVDSINIFHFIADILGRSINNPVCKFFSFSDIEVFLREQWAGLFQELLRARVQSRQLTTLSAQISALSKLNETLKAYAEALLQQVKPTESRKLIRQEEAKLRDVEAFTDFVTDADWHELSRISGRSLESLFLHVKDAGSLEEFLRLAFGDSAQSTAIQRERVNEVELIAKIEGLRKRLGLRGWMPDSSSS